jgi:hypothetical protein
MSSVSIEYSIMRATATEREAKKEEIEIEIGLP